MEWGDRETETERIKQTNTKGSWSLIKSVVTGCDGWCMPVVPALPALLELRKLRQEVPG